MDNYALRPEPKVKRKSPVWNILTVLVLLAACAATYYFWSVFKNPYSFLNPFPPVALPTVYQTATFTPSIQPLEPTWTYTATIKPSPTRTKAPTWTRVAALITPLASATPRFSPTPLESPTITGTPMPVIADVSYVASTSVHADSACNWIGVGGKVVDADGKPLTFQTVQLSGTLNGKAVNMMLLSGHDNEDPYGTSGFEFFLGNTPVDSSHTLWIILFDNQGKPLSAKTYLDTFTDCSKNLVMVTFTKNR